MFKCARHQFALSLCLSLALACGRTTPTESPAPAVDAAAANAGWDEFVQQYLNSYFAARPDVAIWAGRHEFDGRLPDWTSDGLGKEAARLRDWRGRAEAFDAQGLDASRRFERDYLVAQADGDLFWLERADWPHRSPTFYLRALDPDIYVTRPYAPLPDRMRAYVNYARAVPAAAEQIRQNMRTPLPRTYVDRGVSAFGGLASFLTDNVSKVFASVGDPALQREFKAANDAAAKAFQSLAAWFEAQRPQATNDFALGDDLFNEMIWATERVDVPLDRLEQVGRADLERNLAALRDACARFAPGQALAECTRLVGARKPPEGPVVGARRQLMMLRQFIDERSLVTILGTEQAMVGEAPPYNRANLAYINIPGPYERNLPSTYTSPRPTLRGQPQNAQHMSKAKRRCFLSPYTKSGRATSFSSYTRSGPLRSSARFLSATPLRRDGDIMRKR